MSSFTPPFALPEIADRGPGWWAISELSGVPGTVRLRRVGLLWLVVILASIDFGVANVAMGWNGIEFHLWGIPVQVTLYPPFVLSVLIAFWLGPSWAVAPIYVANLASALASGLSWPMSAVFTIAGVIETLKL